MPYEIRENVPLPRKNKDWPFDKLRVGDSFVLGKDDNLHSFRSCASSKAKALGRKFSVLKQDDGTYACWRVA